MTLPPSGDSKPSASDAVPEVGAASNAYAQAGVDTAAGDRAVELMKAAVQSTQGPQTMEALGGFAGLWDAGELRAYRHPVLATATDGVGTKVAIAQAMDIHHTVGRDLVAMVVDDVVVCGAKPLFMTDYIATGHVVPATIAAIVEGVAAGCQDTDTTLLGGETAEHPGTMAPDEYDLAGAAVGVVEKDCLLGAQRVQQGDVVIGLASSGLHSNGFSLVRAVVKQLGWALDRPVPDFGRTLGEELLEPTRLYARVCVTLGQRLGTGLHALSHVTGGGMAANLARVMPKHLGAVVSRAAWPIQPVFQWLHQAGQISWLDLEHTVNLGIGMVAVVAQASANEALDLLAGAGQQAVPIGEVGITPDLQQQYQVHGANPADWIAGAKGVKGGSVLLVDHYTEG